MRTRPVLSLLLVGSLSAACTVRRVEPSTREHDHMADGDVGVSLQGQGVAGIPAGAATVADRLSHSPRHGEWAMIRSGQDSIRAWVEYPERATKAPVVVVIHEIFGLSTWVRGVADQLAADGYIAVAPDLLTGKVALQGDTATQSDATAAIRTLNPADVQRYVEAAARYGMSLPAALPRYGVVGFCWGGGTSFAQAVQSPAGLAAAVVYYGTPPMKNGALSGDDLARVKVPVLGFYGGEDARVTATVPPTDSAMKALGKSYDAHVMQGAKHGFLRAQDGPANEANLAASKQAWPLTVAFFRSHLGA